MSIIKCLTSENHNHAESDPNKNTMLIKKESNIKKKLENKYLFRREIFLHEKLSDKNFFKKGKFHWLIQADSASIQ